MFSGERVPTGREWYKAAHQVICMHFLHDYDCITPFLIQGVHNTIDECFAIQLGRLRPVDGEWIRLARLRPINRDVWEDRVSLVLLLNQCHGILQIMKEFRRVLVSHDLRSSGEDVPERVREQWS